MSNIIMKKDGTPFPTRRNALAQAARYDGANVIAVDGGFAIEVEGDAKPKRPERTPIGTRNKLTIPPNAKRKDYVYRFFNDKDDRIRDALDAGYEFVSTDESGVEIGVGDEHVGADSPKGSRVTKHVGGGTQAYLMKIKKEYYEEDQAAKQRKVDLIDQSMKQREEGRDGSIKGRYGYIRNE